DGCQRGQGRPAISSARLGHAPRRAVAFEAAGVATVGFTRRGCPDPRPNTTARPGGSWGRPPPSPSPAPAAPRGEAIQKGRPALIRETPADTTEGSTRARCHREPLILTPGMARRPARAGVEVAAPDSRVKRPTSRSCLGGADALV